MVVNGLVNYMLLVSGYGKGGTFQISSEMLDHEANWRQSLHGSKNAWPGMTHNVSLA